LASAETILILAARAEASSSCAWAGVLLLTKTGYLSGAARQLDFRRYPFTEETTFRESDFL
jgi:hypothetical protein